MTKSQKFQLYDHPTQMEPLLPSEHRLGPLLERAHDLIRHADRLASWCPTGALPSLRQMLRAMNSYYSNRIEGQHTLPLEIEQALRNDYALDADKARRQRLALSHMATENQLECLWPQWTNAQVWSPQTVQDIHQDLFARLTDQTRAGGAGLGLAICREIMANLGGSIDYVPGQGGAAFRVIFPQRQRAR